jgi:hypothetical protein
MKTLVMLVIAEQPMNSNDIQCVASYLNLGDVVSLDESSFAIFWRPESGIGRATQSLALADVPAIFAQ